MMLQGEARLAVHSGASSVDSDSDVRHFAEKGQSKPL